jgi:hypothetical protein
MNKKVVENYVQSIPDAKRGIFLKALSGSRANAIKAKCLDCCCFQQIEVAHCATVTCPLHKFRPYQKHAFLAKASEKYSTPDNLELKDVPTQGVSEVIYEQ